MPRSDQGISTDRYAVIPRTLIFLRRGDSYLLIKGSSAKRLWAGKYNGIGGHVERGEDVIAAARRELHEETGLAARLWMCSTVMVDAGEIGVCLYVFSGEAITTDLAPSLEGTAEWIPYKQLRSLPLVDDVPELLAKIHAMQPGDPPFAARSYYDDTGKLCIQFEG